MRLVKPLMETHSSSRRTKMPGNYPEEYGNKFVPEENEFTPWPPDTNDKPFMTYESLMKGAAGKPAPKQGK
jgi:hypothetical protein